jgi:hypothetical protein
VWIWEYVDGKGVGLVLFVNPEYEDKGDLIIRAVNRELARERRGECR